MFRNLHVAPTEGQGDGKFFWRNKLCRTANEENSAKPRGRAKPHRRPPNANRRREYFGRVDPKPAPRLPRSASATRADPAATRLSLRWRTGTRRRRQLRFDKHSRQTP